MGLQEQLEAMVTLVPHTEPQHTSGPAVGPSPEVPIGQLGPGVSPVSAQS